MWPSILTALLVALLLSLPLVWLLGWRRPGASAEESAALSGLFLFVLVFAVTWALGGWLRPWGPTYLGVPWLLALIVAAFVALLVLVASPVSSKLPTGGATAREIRSAEGIGLMFWVLIVLMLTVGVLGTTRVAT